MRDENYFDHMEEDVLHDAYLMIVSDDTDYDSIEDVLLGETIYEQHALDFWAQKLDNN